MQEVSKGKKKDSLGTRLEAAHVIFGKDSSCLLSVFGELGLRPNLKVPESYIW